MRVRIYGTEKDVDLACEVLCVLSNVASVRTYPARNNPEAVMRYLTLELDQSVLEDLGVTRAPYPHA